MKTNESPPSPQAATPSGYARLARRLTAWTSNLLASAIVLVLALGGGRQLVDWYREDPLPPDRTSSQPLLGAPGSEPVALELASGHYTLRRESVAAEVDVATDRLQRFCREVLASAKPPTESPSESEQRLLASLADNRPVEEAAGRFRIYQLPGSMPMVVGVREMLESAQTLAEPRGRVLAWGIAVPSGQNDWILYQHQVKSDGALRTPEDLPIPLPAGGKRTLTITGRGGERTFGFSGHGDADDWQRHFDRHLKQQAWQPRGWQTGGTGWHARYEQATGRSAEVHFAGDRQGRLHGLVIIGPHDDET